MNYLSTMRYWISNIGFSISVGIGLHLVLPEQSKLAMVLFISTLHFVYTFFNYVRNFNRISLKNTGFRQNILISFALAMQYISIFWLYNSELPLSYILLVTSILLHYYIEYNYVCHKKQKSG